MLPIISGMPGIITEDPGPGPITSFTSAWVGRESAAATITLPDSINAGDLLILDDIDVMFRTPADVIPSGWTKAYSHQYWNWSGAGNEARRVWSYKIAAGNEASTSITGMADGSYTNFKQVYRIRPNRPIQTASFVGAGMHASQNTTNTLAISSSTETLPVICLGGYFRGGSGSGFGSNAQSNRAWTDARSLGSGTEGSIFAFRTVLAYDSAPTWVAQNMQLIDVSNQNEVIMGYFRLT